MANNHEQRGQLERATRRVGGEESLVVVKIDGQRHEMRTSASAIEIAQHIKRSAARRRAEARMKQRGI